MTPIQTFVFYFSVPIAESIHHAFYQTGPAQFASRDLYFLSWFVMTLPGWALNDLFSRFWAKVLNKYNVSLFLILALGVTVTTVMANAPLSLIRDALFVSYLEPGSSFTKMWPYDFTNPAYIGGSAMALAEGMALWITVNYIFYRFVGIDRYGFRYEPNGETSKIERAANAPALNDSPGPEGSARAPIFLERLPVGAGAELVALQAQEHYTKVYTRQGEHLILFRFGDALKELDHENGIQVHRSHWVKLDAITEVQKNGHALQILMCNGLSVPVSRSYRLKLSEAGLL
jgi:hypothetical protein